MNIVDLVEYFAAWNDHDVERIMSFMSEDCIFETGGGSERFGTRYQGNNIVRERIVEVWTEIPDVKFTNIKHMVQGDRGCSEWTLTGIRNNGAEVEVDGCDVFTFSDGKITSKRSYVKNRS